MSAQHSLAGGIGTWAHLGATRTATRPVYVWSSPPCAPNPQVAAAGPW